MMKLYSAEWCTYCQPVKKLIKEQNYNVEIIDADVVGIQSVKDLGIRTLPTLQKDDGSFLSEASAIILYLKENC